MGHSRLFQRAVRAALEKKDVETVARMVQLPEGMDEELARALQGQRDLVVTFSDLSVEPVGSDAAVAKYSRADSFLGRNGQRVTVRQRLAQSFRVPNGALLAERARPM